MRRRHARPGLPLADGLFKHVELHRELLELVVVSELAGEQRRCVAFRRGACLSDHRTDSHD